MENKQTFDEQWAAVKREHPEVAIRYLELLHLILEINNNSRLDLLNNFQSLKIPSLSILHKKILEKYYKDHPPITAPNPCSDLLPDEEEVIECLKKNYSK